LFENLKGRDHLGDLGLDGRIILKWILKTSMLRWCGRDSSGSGCVPVAGLFNISSPWSWIKMQRNANKL
jgi:hypothetical protein